MKAGWVSNLLPQRQKNNLEKNKMIKKIIKILAVLLVLLILAALIVPQFIDLRRFTPAVAKLVKEQTGRDIRFDGEIKLSIFPWIKVTANDVALSNANGFAPDDMFSAGRLAVSVKFLPLLKRQIEIGNVEVDRLKFHYTVDPKGVTNLDDIFALMDKEVPYDATAPDISDSPGFDLSSLKISGIKITNSLLSYEDMKAGSKITAFPLELKTGAVALGEPITLDFSTDIAGEGPEFKAALAIKTVVTALTDKITLTGLTGKASLLFDNSSISADMQADADYDLKATLLTIASLALSSDIKLPDVNEKLTANTALSYDTGAGSFNIPTIEVSLSDIKLVGSAKGSGLNDKPVITADLATGELKLRSILSKLGLKDLLHDPNTYQNAALSFKLDLRQNKLNAPLNMSLDDMKISANITGDFSGSKLALDVPLTLNGINADKYLPKSKAPAPQTKQNTNEPLKIELPQLDLSGLPDINLRLDAGFVEYSGLRTDKLVLRSTLKNSMLNVSSLSASIFGGSLSANASVIGRAKAPLEGSTTLKLTGIDTVRLMKYFDAQADTSTLPRRMNLNFNGTLKNNVLTVTNSELGLDELLAKFNATAKLDGRPTVAVDIALNDVNLDKLLPASDKTASDKQKEQASAAELPLKALMDTGIDLTGTLTAKSLTTQNITVRDIKSKLVMQDGAVILSPTTANLYQGKLKADITLKEEGERIKETVKISVDNASLGDLFGAVGKTNRPFLTGKLSASADLNSTGVAVQDILTSMLGNISYDVPDGILQGISYDPNNPTNLRRGNTKLNPVKGAGAIKDGVLQVAPMSVISEYLGADLSGGIDLRDMSLNLGGNVDVSGMKMPFTVKGSALEPKVGIDEKAVTQALVQKYAKGFLAGTLSGKSGDNGTKSGAQNLLNEALGGKSGDNSSGKSELGNILGNILGGGKAKEATAEEGK